MQQKEHGVWIEGRQEKRAAWLHLHGRRIAMPKILAIPIIISELLLGYAFLPLVAFAYANGYRKVGPFIIHETSKEAQLFIDLMLKTEGT